MQIDDLVSNSCARAEISETLRMLRIQGTLHPQTRVACERIVDELRQMPQRDRFELIVDAQGNTIKLSGFDDDAVRLFFEEVNEYDDVEPADILLTVIKTIFNGRLSIYSLDCFTKYISSETFANVLDEFQAIHSGYLELEVQHAFLECRTATIAFVERNHVTSLIAVSSQDRQEKLDMLADNCTVANNSDRFLPTDFAFIVPSENGLLQTVFSSICAMLCLRFLANHSSLEGNIFNYKVVGYKTVIGENIAVTDLLPARDVVLKIFEWAYDGPGNSDKIGLVRNVFSLHLDLSGRIQFGRELWTAVQSNYQIYLKGNVENYLEVKSRVSQMVVDFGSKTFEFSDQMLSSFKSNALIIITFLLTVVLVNGLKDTGEVTIFSGAYVFIVLAVSAVSVLWLYLTRNDVLGRFDTASQSIAEILKLSFGQVLLEAEIRNTVDPMIALNRRYLMSQMRKYTIWWAVILGVFVLAFVLGYYVFARPEKNKAGVSSSKAANSEIARPFDSTSTPRPPGKSVEERKDSKETKSPPTAKHLMKQSEVKDGIATSVRPANTSVMKKEEQPTLKKKHGIDLPN